MHDSPIDPFFTNTDKVKLLYYKLLNSSNSYVYENSPCGFIHTAHYVYVCTYNVCIVRAHISCSLALQDDKIKASERKREINYRRQIDGRDDDLLDPVERLEVVVEVGLLEAGSRGRRGPQLDRVRRHVEVLDAVADGDDEVEADEEDHPGMACAGWSTG